MKALGLELVAEQVFMLCFFFFLGFFNYVDHFKSLLNVTILLLLFFLYSGILALEACGILVRPGIKPTAPGIEGEVLSTDHRGSPSGCTSNRYS